MLRITDLPGPTLRLEGVLSGPEVDAAAQHCAAVLSQHQLVVIDLEYVTFADGAGIRWLRGLPSTSVTISKAPLMIEELLREEGAA